MGKVFESFGADTRVYVISILGIQNSGKSTLLNTLFGSEFTVKDGRCTKGANWKLLRVNQQYIPYIEYILIIDTEGLMALEANTRKYDRQLTLFAMAVSHMILFNNNEELEAGVRDYLGCCIDSLASFEGPTLPRPALFLIINQLIDTNKEMSNQIEYIRRASGSRS